MPDKIKANKRSKGLERLDSTRTKIIGLSRMIESLPLSSMGLTETTEAADAVSEILLDIGKDLGQIRVDLK